jgi:ubiquinone/menaquinone biosynthesis C-methylase UbiE
MGDVNVDLHIGVSEHRDTKPLKPREIPNFVLCDACYLPFRDNSFEKVFCKDALEHVGKKPQRTNLAPYKALKELVRVASKTIEVYVPHRFSLSNCEKKFWIRRHNAFFNLKWFETSVQRIEKELNVKLSILSAVLYKPLLIYFLMMPDEIHLILIKRKLK